MAKPKTPEQMRREVAMRAAPPMPGMVRRFDPASGVVKYRPMTPKEFVRQARPKR